MEVLASGHVSGHYSLLFSSDKAAWYVYAGSMVSDWVAYGTVETTRKRTCSSQLALPDLAGIGSRGLLQNTTPCFDLLSSLHMAHSAIEDLFLTYQLDDPKPKALHPAS